MKNCSNCGVSLEEHMNFCPLCGEPSPDNKPDDQDYIRVRKRQHTTKPESQYQRLSRREKLKLSWEISGLLLFSGVLITIVIDLMFGFNLSWSKYPSTICMFLFAGITLIRFFPQRPFIIIPGFLLIFSAMFLLLDAFDGSLSWSLTLGLPLLLATMMVSVILLFITRRVRQKGFNLIAYALLAAAVLSFITETLLSLQHHGIIRLRWSLVVVATLIPVAALLFFFHYRLKKGTDLRRFFHI